MASPFMDGYVHILDNTGTPISGAKLNFYQSGTSTQKDTFADEALNTTNANPVVCDANGRAGPIYLETGDSGYKVVITDADDVTLETIDPVSQQVDRDDLTASAGFYRGDVTETGKPYFHLGSIRLWFDDANSVFRYKDGADPSTETDGTALTTTYDDAFNESSLLDLGGYKVWRQADGQWRTKNGTPSSSSDGTLLSNLFSGDFGDGATDLIRMDRSGTIYFLWIDTNGDLRIKSSAPSSDTDGARVGESVAVKTGDLLDTSTGTSVNATDLGTTTPQRITLAFDNVSLDGTDNLLVQLGDSGGIETSGYTAGVVQVSSSGQTYTTATSGFIIGLGNGTRAFSGEVTLTNVTGNVWTASVAGSDTAFGQSGGGRKELSAAITQVTVKPTGSDNFDGGQIRVLSEA